MSVAVKRLLYVYRGEGAPTRPAFAYAMEALGWSIDLMVVSHYARLRGIPAVLFSGRSFGAYDLIVANEYNLTWALCLRLLPARKPRLVALGFNQSSRLIRSGLRPVDKLLNRLWRRAAAYLVHSREEGQLFAKVHDIPRERFIFSHWGYDLPAHNPAATPLPPPPYVSMIGRNNRDINTFCQACGKAGVGGVVVTSADLASRAPQPAPVNVLILANRSMEDCLNYVAGSLAHLVLVRDGGRGAGHISAVSAMLLAKPQIFSHVATIADYLIDDLNGIAVPLADPDATAAAIIRLRDEPLLCERLGQEGLAIAEKSMSHRASAERLILLLTAVAEGRPLQSAN